MAQGEHSHWDKYHVRTIEKCDDKEVCYEVIQCICLYDGVIFKEEVLKNKKGGWSLN